MSRIGDYSDFQIGVDLIFDGDKFLSVFSHDHVHPTELEYARLDDADPRKGLLEYMRKVLYSRESELLFSDEGRTPNRISEILLKLEKVWRQYPDMRLGQLLLTVCGNGDFFSMEDKNCSNVYNIISFRLRNFRTRFGCQKGASHQRHTNQNKK